MLCGLTYVFFGMYPFGVMYKSCEYRCPPPSFYYHYPKKIKTIPEARCPKFIIVGRDA